MRSVVVVQFAVAVLSSLQAKYPVRVVVVEIRVVA